MRAPKSTSHPRRAPPLSFPRSRLHCPMSATEGQDSNPFLNEEEQTPFQEEALDSPPAPASIPLPSSFSAEAYPQDDPPAAFTSSAPSTPAADPRNRSASVASSVKPPKDAIQVSDDAMLLKAGEVSGKGSRWMAWNLSHYGAGPSCRATLSRIRIRLSDWRYAGLSRR